ISRDPVVSLPQLLLLTLETLHKGAPERQLGEPLVLVRYAGCFGRKGKSGCTRDYSEV
ncbi:hypothetical protein PanWU01x14_223760, partial [Parasponia andersonii]